MLSRKMFSHRIWKASRTFSECEAWIDLIQSARFDTTVITERIGCREITYGRGQYPASISFLAERWGWTSDKKVRTFLDMLKKEGMITTDGSQGVNVITLCKYDEYNPFGKGQGKRQGEGQAIGEPKGKGENIDIVEKIRELECELKELKARHKASKGQAIGEPKGNNINKDINNNIISPSIPQTGEAVASAPDMSDKGVGEKGKTWRNDYETYLNLVRTAYQSICSDKDLLDKQQKYYPNVDIKLSIEKACANYWATEAGWKKKKSSRSKDIDMRMTLINAININKVYNAKEQTETKRYDNGDFLR